MLQNIKVDIIYYKGKTDFEMEFNLSGCCRMRLLTDKAPEKKILVSQLARAVSRSRVIIVVGALFGNESIVKISAAAIGKKMVAVDNAKYGIQGVSKIEVIENSIPLVGDDGVFGGCIIEQGPQTLILLTENQNLRKKIMNTLIQPYIQEICVSDVVGKKSDLPQEKAVLTESDLIMGDEEFEDENIENDELGDGADENQILGDTLVMDSEDGYYDEDSRLAGEIILEEEDYLRDFIQSERATITHYTKQSEELLLGNEDENQDDIEDEIDILAEEANAFVAGNPEGEEEENEIVAEPRGIGVNISIIIVGIILAVVIAVLFYCLVIVPAQEGVPADDYLNETLDELLG